MDIGKEAILRAASGSPSATSSASWRSTRRPTGSSRPRRWGTVGDVEARIAGIKADGQTNIIAGLTAAVESLEGVQARAAPHRAPDRWLVHQRQYDEILARMKAAGITLSAVGAGGGGASVPGELAEPRRRALLDAARPGLDPGHLPEGDPEVAGAAIIEEAVLPGPDVGLADPTGLEDDGSRSCWATTARPSSPRPSRCSSRPRRSRSLPNGSTAGGAVAWTSDATGRWARDWMGWDGFARFFRQPVAWTFPGEETGGIEARFDSAAGSTHLHVESVESDGSPRDFYETTAVVVGPDLEPRNVALKPHRARRLRGIARRDRSRCLRDPGHQTRPGTTPLGARSGWSHPPPPNTASWGPTSRSWPPCRAATGGSVVETPLDPWVHDLTATSRFTELWPLLLGHRPAALATHIALRRVSIGRREFAAAGAWSGASAGGALASPNGPRPGPACWPHASGPRPPGPGPRCAPMRSRSRRGDAGGLHGRRRRAHACDAERALASGGAIRTRFRAGISPATAHAVRIDGTAPCRAGPPAPAAGDDTMARLRDAKRRARDVDIGDDPASRIGSKPVAGDSSTSSATGPSSMGRARPPSARAGAPAPTGEAADDDAGITMTATTGAQAGSGSRTHPRPSASGELVPNASVAMTSIAWGHGTSVVSIANVLSRRTSTRAPPTAEMVAPGSTMPVRRLERPDRRQ